MKLMKEQWEVCRSEKELEVWVSERGTVDTDNSRTQFYIHNLDAV